MAMPNEFGGTKMNPDVHARLMAFQAKRQQLQSQSQQPSGSQTPSQVTEQKPQQLPPQLPPQRASQSQTSQASPRSPAADELSRRTSFRIQKHEDQTMPAASSPSDSLKRNNSYSKSSASSNAFHINKSVEYITRVKMEQAQRARSGSVSSQDPPSPSDGDVSGSATGAQVKGPMATKGAKGSCATNSSPTTPISPKLSLSQRRGMKLDFNALSPQGTPPTSAPNSGQLASPVGQLEDAVRSMSMQDRMRKSTLPDRRQRPNLRMPQPQAGLGLGNSTAQGAPSIPAPSGMFASYSKYVDVKSGSLNFAGKASVHSRGIEFSNGTAFRISMDDLEFMEELGRGNYGVVSKVLHKPTGIVMAMKEVRLELDDSKFTQILMELEVLHSCQSDCIVEFYGAFFVEGAVYMCMEYMMGGSIDKIYGDGISEIGLQYITKRVVAGLRELKDQHNIIHRDVKPTNMLVNEQGVVKLCDFGVSGNLVASLARTNIGCQSYMAPERIKHIGDDSYSVQSDIWSLGLSILEIAKGCYPYPPETFNNVFSQLSAIVDGEPPKLPDKFSEDAKDFVAQCLNKNPHQRPTYSQLLDHKWLVSANEPLGRAELAKLVTTPAQLPQSASHLPKSVPALHRGGNPIA